MAEKKEIELFTVDSFTEKPFSGNPAAVCLLRGSLVEIDDKTRQQIAAEMNISETSFIEIPEEKEKEKEKEEEEERVPRFGLRWFTPTVEVPLCGHATLASAFVAFHQGLVKGNVVEFQTLSGVLRILKSEDGSFCMDLPKSSPAPVDYEPISDLLSEKLNFPKGVKIVDSQFCEKTRKFLVEIESSDPSIGNTDHLTGLKVEATTLTSLKLDSMDIRGVIVTTLPSSKIGKDVEFASDYDFVSRYFAPWNGINEDPVTGSAHTVLAVHWEKKLNERDGEKGEKERKMRAFQASERGGGMSVLVKGDRVLIFGRATLVLQGKFFL